MATSKKTTGKAAKTTGTTTKGATGGTAVATPEGYTTGSSKFYAENVMRRFSALPAGGGAVRLLLVTNKGTTNEQVTGLLGNPRMQLKMGAPNIWAATLTVDDMDAL